MAQGLQTCGLNVDGLLYPYSAVGLLLVRLRLHVGRVGNLTQAQSEQAQPEPEGPA